MSDFIHAVRTLELSDSQQSQQRLEQIVEENDALQHRISSLTAKLDKYEQYLVLDPKLDPDPYGLFGFPISDRLEAMRITTCR